MAFDGTDKNYRALDDAIPPRATTRSTAPMVSTNCTAVAAPISVTARAAPTSISAVVKRCWAFRNTATPAQRKKRCAGRRDLRTVSKKHAVLPRLDIASSTTTRDFTMNKICRSNSAREKDYPATEQLGLPTHASDFLGDVRVDCSERSVSIRHLTTILRAI